MSVNDLWCRRRAMCLVGQLPDNPVVALRVIEHMRALLSFVGGETDDAAAAPPPSAKKKRNGEDVAAA